MLSNYAIKNASDTSAASSSNDLENVSLVTECAFSRSQKKPSKGKGRDKWFYC